MRTIDVQGILLLRAVHFRIQARISRELRKRRGRIGIRLAEVLHEVLRNPGQSGAELARSIGISAQSLNNLLVSLEKSRYIRRVEDPNNPRIRRCYPLPAGAKLMAQVGEDIGEVCDSVLAPLRSWDRSELMRLLRLLV